MKEKSFDFYVQGTIQLGMAFGVVSLLARWITGNTILSSPETLINYGLIGSIGYAFTGGLVLVLFSFIARKVSYSFAGQMTIGDVLKAKMNTFGYWYMMIQLMVLGIYALFIQVIGAGLLLYMIFQTPYVIGLGLFLALIFLVGGIGGLYRIHQLAGVGIILIFGTIILIPVNLYMQQGVTKIFEGIQLYHPYLLFTKDKESLWFILTGLLIFSGQVLTDRATWQRMFVIKKEKVKTAFVLTGFIWMTIPISVGSLFLLATSGHAFDTPQSLIMALIQTIESHALVSLFILFCLMAVLSAASSELHALNSLFIRNFIGELKDLSVKKQLLYKNIFSLIVIFALLIFSILLTPYPVQLLFFFGNVYSTLIFPFLFIVFAKGKETLAPVLSSFVGLSAGFISSFFVSYFESVWIGFLSSGMVCGGIIIKKWIRGRLHPAVHLEVRSYDAK